MTSKSQLNLYCQKSHTPTPCYTTERIEDSFISTVTVKIAGLGLGIPATNECYKSQRPQTTKKAAENDAATVAVDAVVQKHPGYSSIDKILDWLDSQAATNSTKKRSSSSRQQYTQQVVATTPERQSLQSQVSIQPPIGVPPGPRQAPTSSRPPLPQSQITVQGPLGPSSINPPPQQQSNVPMDPQWDRHHGKPSSACIVNSYPLANSTPMSPKSPTSVPKFNQKTKHQEMLEEYCKAHDLPVPKYSIRQVKTNQYIAVVTVGDMEFPTDYQFDTFEKAKDNATLLAIAGVGVRSLTIAETGQQQPTPSPASSVQPSTQPTISKPQLCRSTTQQSVDTALQPPSYFQKSFQQVKLQAQTTRHGQLTLDTASHATGTPCTAPDLQMPSLELAPSWQQASSTVDTMPPPQAQDVRSSQEQQPKVDLHIAHANYKQILNEYCSKNRIPAPQYGVEFPKDSVGYISTVTVSGERFSSPPLGSKKLADNSAAAEAVKALGILTQDKGVSTTVQTQKSVSPTRAVDGESQSSKTGAESFISFKNLLQEHVQKTKATLPYYETNSGEEGYVSTVSVQQPSGGQALRFTSGGHSVKKAAEQEAARIACTEMGLLQPKSL